MVFNDCAQSVCLHGVCENTSIRSTPSHPNACIKSEYIDAQVFMFLVSLNDVVCLLMNVYTFMIELSV